MNATETPYPLIDIGANLGHESFHDDLDQVLEAARRVGIETILVTGTSVESSRRALELARAHPGYLYSTVGLHPHDAKLFDAETTGQMRELAAHPEVKAIGELGLDFNRDFSPRDTQETVFQAQLELAVELQLPVFLHQRDAHDSFIRILQQYRPRLKDIVVHCFTGAEDELAHYLELDAYIGITGWVCDERRGYHLHDLLERIPPARLMLETDAPYLLPRTIRPRPKTRRNQPANLPYVVETVAACLDLTAGEVARRSTENARRFFNL